MLNQFKGESKEQKHIEAIKNAETNLLHVKLACSKAGRANKLNVQWKSLL